MSDRNYLSIVAHYESCLDRFGDTHQGVDWPSKDDAATRYRIMLDVVRKPTSEVIPTLLDLGCGASHMYEYMIENGITEVRYAGLDISEKFVDLSRSKFPEIQYLRSDILAEPASVPVFDYVVMNGVLTEKRELSYDEMLDYSQRLIKAAFEKARIGLAFNVMSKHVDWERDDLFHLPFDTLAAFLRSQVTRHYSFVNDYGLHEYTAYVYKEAR